MSSVSLGFVFIQGLCTGVTRWGLLLASVTPVAKVYTDHLSVSRNGLDGGGERCADVPERGVDVAGKPLHACSRCEGNKSNNQGILNEILTFFAAQQALDPNRQHQNAILHFISPWI